MTMELIVFLRGFLCGPIDFYGSWYCDDEYDESYV